MLLTRWGERAERGSLLVSVSSLGDILSPDLRFKKIACPHRWCPSRLPLSIVLHYIPPPLLALAVPYLPVPSLPLPRHSPPQQS